MTEHIIDIDAELGNADWTKRTWDLPREKTELDALLRRTGDSYVHLRTLPIWNTSNRPTWLDENTELDFPAGLL